MKFLIELMYVRDPESIITLLALRGGTLLSDESFNRSLLSLVPVLPNAIVSACAWIDGEIPHAGWESSETMASPVL